MPPSREETPGHTGQELRVSLEFLSVMVLHFTLDVNGYPVVSLNDQGASCCVVYP